jgi:NTE family protein
MDWRRSDEIADRGYRAAAALPGLATLGVDDAAWAAYLAARDARRRTVDPTPTLLSVSGVLAQEQATIRGALTHHLGKSLDGDAISRDLTAITGSARYDTVTYQIVRQPEGIELAIKATPKSYGPPFLRFTLDVTNAGTSTLEVGVRGRLSAFDVVGYNSEVRLDTMVGTGFSLAAELYKPIGKSRLFVAPRAGIQWSDQETFSDSRRTEDYRTDRTFIGADVGVSLSRDIEWRVGWTYGHRTAAVEGDESGLPRYTGYESVAGTRFVYDGQDAVVVPSRGVKLDASLLRIIDGVEPDTAAPAAPDTARRTLGEIVSSVFVPVSRRHRMMLSFSGGTSFGASPDSYYDFALGGPTRLRAYDIGEFRGSNYLLASLAYLHNLGRLPDFMGGPIYLAGAVETGSAFAELKSARARTALSTGVILDTLLGPVTLTAGVSVDGHFRFYANVGRAFR